MASICILTDNTAQFPQLGFSGRNDVRIVPFGILFDGTLYPEGHDLRSNDLPPAATQARHPSLVVPTAQEFEELYLNLNQHYSNVIAILSSSSLNGAFANAQKAAAAVQGRAHVSVIDSQTTSVGLGMIVQAAAEAVAQGQSAASVERMVRSLIPHAYMMLCTPAMSYLAFAGYIDPAQAFVGEMLGLMPIFTLEEGQLSAVEKVRNTRSLVDFMQEFVCEFEDVLHVAFIQSYPPLTHEAKLMREHVQTCFPQTPFSEHNINPVLATLIGPRSIALIAVEKPDHIRRF